MKHHPTKTSFRGRLFIWLIAAIVTTTVFSVSVWAQSAETLAMRKQAMQLMDDQKMTEALPLLEKLSVLMPNDPAVFLNLGFADLAQGVQTPAGDARRQLRIKAREAFIKANQLGDDSQLVKGMIDGLPADGSDGKGFSDNAAVNKLMEQGEASFTSGKLDEAFDFYQKALKMDPRCYYAALFSGDVFMHQEKWADAETWYQKAISIDPNIETAYRYSATPLMKQQKFDLAWSPSIIHLNPFNSYNSFSGSVLAQPRRLRRGQGLR